MTTMTMPEATVYEYDLASTPKYDIGLARQVRAMQAVAIATRMQATSQRQFRCSVSGADPRHLLAPLFRGDSVHRISPLGDQLASFEYECAEAHVTGPAVVSAIGPLNTRMHQPRIWADRALADS